MDSWYNFNNHLTTRCCNTKMQPLISEHLAQALCVGGSRHGLISRNFE